MRETGDDPALRAELLELLACDNGGGRTGPLTLALGAALDTTTRDRRKALVGRVVGNYKLVSVLGHGGTGTVYLGERADRQYSAQVAVKIVDNGTMQGELGLRFRAERQILASLNHANIARLLDAGETEEGKPYLVMEYVHGEPLDRYCDRQQLGLRERLQLFLEICSAVQYAHQNLVVHRDLKPANILVTAEGAPKLLDFGIAKLLDAGEAAAVLALTRMNDRLLTPEYASPEQILGRPVTTASDVYALGVVLYELLTGLRPYTVPASASQLELERSICITDPLRPSAAVKTRARKRPAAKGNRRFSPSQPRASSRRISCRSGCVGDIDAIVMRALRKEPQHRYGSIEQLAADVRRYPDARARVGAPGQLALLLAAVHPAPCVRRVGRRCVHGVHHRVRDCDVGAEPAHRRGARSRGAGKRARRESLELHAGRVHRRRPVRELRQSESRSHGPRAARPGGPQHSGAISTNNPRRAHACWRLSGAPIIARASRSARSPSWRMLCASARRPRRPRALRWARRSRSLRLHCARLAASRNPIRRLKEAMEISRTANDQHSMAYARLLIDIGRLHIEQSRPLEAEKVLETALQLARQLRGPRDPEVAAILSDISVAAIVAGRSRKRRAHCPGSCKDLRDHEPDASRPHHGGLSSCGSLFPARPHHRGGRPVRARIAAHRR